MTVKKKVLIALLSTTCVAAAATGLAACNPDPAQGPDPAYTVTAIDQNGNGVEGVTFRIGYYQNYTTNYVYDNGKVLTATTGANGKATFKNFTPEEGIQYSVYLAEASGSERVYPYGYSIAETHADFDENWYATYDFTYAPSSFLDNPCGAIEYYRTFDDSNFDETDESTMKYVEHGSTTLTLSLKGGIHTYFTFQTYKELGSDEGFDSTNPDSFQGSEKLDYNQYWATKAAAGVYTVSFSSSNSSVVMYGFNGMGYIYTVDQYNTANGNETPTNEIGVPYNKIDTTLSGKTGILTRTLTASGNMSRATQFFGIYAQSDCEVTVTLERAMNAEEPPEIPTTKVEAPQNIEKFEAQDGTLTLMTVDGSLACVLGDDGYYHVGSKTGPQLLVNLKETLSRVGQCSIMDLANKDVNPFFATGHIFSVYEDGNLTAVYDYSEFLKAYADKVNSDGVYPVNEELYGFLQLLAAKGQMTETQLAGEYAWLLPCQYYMPDSGMDATGAGTQADPFILIGTTNNLDLSGISGNAYARFTATTYGIYTFAVSGCTIAVDGSKTGFYNDKALLHLCLDENESIIFTVNGDGNASITVGNATANQIEAFYGDDSGEDGAEPSKGLTESNAILLNRTGYSAFIIDKEVNADGVWIYVQPMISGTIDYSFAIKSPLGQIVYDGKTYQFGETLTLTCKGGTKYAFLLTAKDGANNVANGIYALEWSVVEKQAAEDGTLNLGDNEITVSEADMMYGAPYTFTATEDGTYSITTDDADALILDETGYETYVDGVGHFEFTLKAGESFTFYCASWVGSGSHTYNVNIAPFTATGDDSFDDNGGTKRIVLDNSNCDGDGDVFTFVSTTGGTYVISVDGSASAMIYADSASDDDRIDKTPINTLTGKYSYEFTLEAGGYITFAAYIPGYTTGEYDVTIAKK